MSIISKLLEEISVLLRHVSPVGQPQGGRLPVGSSGRLGKWPLRDREILRSSRCGKYYIYIYMLANYLVVAVGNQAAHAPLPGHPSGSTKVGRETTSRSESELLRPDLVE